MVLPQLTPDGSADPVSAPPPRGSRPVVGEPRNIHWVGGRTSAHGLTEAQRSGLRFEQKIHWMLKSTFPVDYHVNPVFAFDDDTGHRTCVPDGLLLHAKDAIVFEIKSQHMPEAWWQLRKLYEPVVKRWWGKPIVCCEVVRSYDPAMGFPESVSFCTTLDEVLGDCLNEFRVLQWRP